MLVARRDPFHPGAQHDPHSDFDSAPRPARAPRLMRTMSALQMIGTLLAIPLGLGSAYTMYRANFSVEASCQSLRANIVSMLDKSVDARTRHMLVHRDVVTFEQSCGGVDPDATAAFKALLAADGAAAGHARAQATPVETKPVEEKPKEIARKPDVKADGAPTQTVAVEAKPGQREAAGSDAAWLAAVRGALTANEAKPRHPARAEAEPVNLTRAVAAPAMAPALPPPATVAAVPAPMQDPDRLIPPASIPDSPAPNVVIAQRPEHSRFGAWVGQLPLVGKMIGEK